MSSKDYIIGADPGKSGAICIMTKGFDIVNLFSFPIIGNDINIPELREGVEPFVGSSRVYLERVHAIQGGGGSSNFNFGRNLGLIEGMFMSMGFPIHRVSPQAWQKISWSGTTPILKKCSTNKSGKKKDTKKMSAQAAASLFPGVDFRDPEKPRSRVPHDGIVDATLIAYAALKGNL